MSICYYILDEENRPVALERTPDNLIVWGRFIERDSCRVGYTQVTSEIRVSTVFLGLDHRFGFGSGPPILFETMIFGGCLDGEQWRYSSWDDAETGHKAAVAKARAAVGQKIKS